MMPLTFTYPGVPASDPIEGKHEARIHCVRDLQTLWAPADISYRA